MSTLSTLTPSVKEYISATYSNIESPTSITASEFLSAYNKWAGLHKCPEANSASFGMVMGNLGIPKKICAKIPSYTIPMNTQIGTVSLKPISKNKSVEVDNSINSIMQEFENTIKSAQNAFNLLKSHDDKIEELQRENEELKADNASMVRNYSQVPANSRTAFIDTIHKLETERDGLKIKNSKLSQELDYFKQRCLKAETRRDELINNMDKKEDDSSEDEAMNVMEDELIPKVVEDELIPKVVEDEPIPKVSRFKTIKEINAMKEIQAIKNSKN